MTELLKHTYLLDLRAIEKDIERLWIKYQKIIGNKKSSWEDLNEARAILYLLGYVYSEKIALESFERRIKLIKPAIGLDEFFSAIDRKNSKVLKKYAKNKKFQKLKEFYLIVKNIKNRVKNNTYLDEERFNVAYSKLKPKNYF